MSCSLHDVIRLEALGIPTAAVGTTPFRTEALEQAQALAMPDYRMIEVPHPIQPLPVERVVALAEDALERAIKTLTSGP